MAGCRRRPDRAVRGYRGMRRSPSATGAGAARRGGDGGGLLRGEGSVDPGRGGGPGPRKRHPGDRIPHGRGVLGPPWGTGRVRSQDPADGGRRARVRGRDAAALRGRPYGGCQRGNPSAAHPQGSHMRAERTWDTPRCAVLVVRWQRPPYTRQLGNDGHGERRCHVSGSLIDAAGNYVAGTVSPSSATSGVTVAVDSTDNGRFRHPARERLLQAGVLGEERSTSASGTATRPTRPRPTSSPFGSAQTLAP